MLENAKTMKSEDQGERKQGRGQKDRTIEGAGAGNEYTEERASME